MLFKIAVKDKIIEKNGKCDRKVDRINKQKKIYEEKENTE